MERSQVMYGQSWSVGMKEFGAVKLELLHVQPLFIVLLPCSIPPCLFAFVGRAIDCEVRTNTWKV